MVSPITGIAEQVSEALRNDPRTQDERIEVAYNQGVITLTGTVKSETARETAEEIARQQGGVVMVINELKTG